MGNTPNLLFIMCDQLRFDSLAVHGNPIIRTPNFDRLARRGIDFHNAYSTCPVCVPARMTIRTGCEPARTGIYENEFPRPRTDSIRDMRHRCGAYLAETLWIWDIAPSGWGNITIFLIAMRISDMRTRCSQRK